MAPGRLAALLMGMQIHTRGSAWQWGTPLLIATAIAIAYAWASAPNGFVYDDHLYIVDQTPVHSFTDAARIFVEPHPGNLPYYRALTRLTLQLQKTISGNNPLPFHQFNALLAGLTFLAAYALLRRPAFLIDRVSALGAALLFTLHPVASSCVYPADSGRETMLPGFLALVSLWAWLGPSRAAYPTALLFFAGAIAGKEQSIVLPAIFLLADGLGFTPANTTVKRWLRYIPVFFIVSAYLLLRHELYGGAEIRPMIFEWPAGPMWSLLFSLQSIFAPPAELAYEPPLEVWRSWPQLLFAMACAGGLLAAALRTSAVRKPALFWIAWFLATQALTANIFYQEARFDERYVFLSALAVMALAAALISQPGRQAAMRRAAGIIACLALLAWGGISLHRARYFRDDLTFYRQWAKTNPKSAIAQYGIGQGLAALGDPTAALGYYESALALRPNYDDALNSRGRALERLGRIDEAVASYERALEVSPGLAEAHNNLATIDAQRGRLQNALAHCEAARRSDPDSPGTYQNLGGVLTLMGNTDGAIAAYEKGLELDPTLVEARINLASVYLTKGRHAEAAAQLEAARALPRLSGQDSHQAIIQALLERCRQSSEN